MISFKDIQSDELERLISKLDECIAFVNSEFGIELKSYGNILRIAINAIQQETIENLIERLSINKELENHLDDAGGYTVDYLTEKNPKAELLKTLHFLREHLPKNNTLLSLLNNITEKTIAVFDSNDLDFISNQIKNSKVEIMTFSSLKKVEIKNKVLVLHSFNGKKDFDYLYNLDCNITLVVYKQEKELYYKCLNQRKNLIESETKSTDRLSICGIEYKEVKDNIINISSTISGIVSRLDDMNSRAYEGFKNECDLLLNEIEEKLFYKVTTNIGSVYLESNDTVFTENGQLIKSYKIKVGDKIRIYPKEQLAENLYQVAVETEPDVFGTVEKHSKHWKLLINELRDNLGDELLYQCLKEKGLKVLPTTLSTYGKGFRKFPMYKNDLRAILKLYYSDKSDSEIELILNPILKSKTTYSSTMIVLGRGLKQELRLFLKEKTIGEILAKKNFKENTLQTFINEFMPLHTVVEKDIFSSDIEAIEETTLEQIEL